MQAFHRQKQLFITALTIMLLTFTSHVFAVTNFQTVSTNAEDAAISAKIKAEYAKDKLVKAHHIKISSDAGIVKLKGKLTTDLQYERAVTLAASVTGVNDVNTDNLKVKDSKQPLADTVITAKVKGRILRDKLLSDKDVKNVRVETKNGKVYLSGKVDNLAQKNSLIALANSVHGVSVVSASDLTV